MNFLELNNKKNEALQTILNQLADLIDLETDNYVKSVSYRVEYDNRYIRFTTIQKGNPKWCNRYILLYNIDTYNFTLDECCRGHGNDSFYILKIHEQLCSKKEEMIKIINQDF